MQIERLLVEKESKHPECIRPDAPLRTAAQKLLKHRIGALVVTDLKGQLKGIVSERDLIQVVAKYDAAAVEAPVAEVMTRSVITCGPNDEITAVLRLMHANAIRHMPVLDHGKLVNMLSIRELTTAYELLQIEANTDFLTELPNRRPFLKTLETEFARSRRYKHPVSVGMIDIDHFKQVNDCYGHDAGDKVLRAVSATMINEFRTVDYLGRLGGEEFAVVLPETDLSDAKLACDRLLKSIQATIIPLGSRQVSVTASIGLARASSTTLDGSAVLKRADELLYDAKRRGRNQVVADCSHGNWYQEVEDAGRRQLL